MRSLLLSVGAALAFAVPGIADAQTFRAENRVVVTDLGNGTFSVPTRNRFGARGTWCAAADYAMSVLGASGTSRVYVRSAKTGPSDPVTFALNAGDATPVAVGSIAAALRAPGANLSVDHAFQFCYDARLINTR